MSPWNVSIDNGVINGGLKKYKSDRRVMKGYRRALSALLESDDPASVGTRKRGRLRNCYSCTLTKSHRMLYMIDREARTVRVLDLGDHKEIYGRYSRA